MQTQTIVHKLVDQYRFSSSKTVRDFSVVLADTIGRSAIFDFGDADQIPIDKSGGFCDAKAPFDEVVLQFSMPKNPVHSHMIVIWHTISDHEFSVTVSLKDRDSDNFRTCLPALVLREGIGFKYERLGVQESQNAIQTGHAMALNAFYVLGCANVRTVDNSAPEKLNKNRAINGKFPIQSYKTLVIDAGKPQAARDDRGGTHSSPRVHLRRGHVRQIEGGRRIWVQPCVVGSKHGVITKDYRVINSNFQAPIAQPDRYTA